MADYQDDSWDIYYCPVCHESTTNVWSGHRMPRHGPKNASCSGSKGPAIHLGKERDMPYFGACCMCDSPDGRFQYFDGRIFCYEHWEAFARAQLNKQSSGSLHHEPCPFCGSLIYSVFKLDDMYAIRCLTCEAIGPPAGVKKNAEDLWDMRTIGDEL